MPFSVSFGVTLFSNCFNLLVICFIFVFEIFGFAELLIRLGKFNLLWKRGSGEEFSKKMLREH